MFFCTKIWERKPWGTDSVLCDAPTSPAGPQCSLSVSKVAAAPSCSAPEPCMSVCGFTVTVCPLTRNTTCHCWWSVGKLLRRGVPSDELALKVTADTLVTLTCPGHSSGTRGICNSISWQHFPTLYSKDGFLIKIQNHTALGSNTRDVCASAFQGAVVDSGVPGIEKSGWLEVSCS